MSSGSQQIPTISDAPYARLMHVISKYLSVRTAITLVNRSLIELGLTPESMVASDLDEIIEQTMPSLRAFVPDAQIDQLVLDLATLSYTRAHSDVVLRPSPSARPASIPSRVDEVVVSSRRRR